MPTYSGIWTSTQQLQSAGGPALWPGVAQPGQQVYIGGYGSTQSGSSTLYTWVCPTGVNSVSVVCVGSGGGGNIMAYQTTPISPGGGGLGWKNNIAVVPGNSYTVAAGDYNSVGPSPGNPTVNGGQSYFIDASTVRGGGGSGAPTATGGTYTGDGGGNGGSGASGVNGYPSGAFGYSASAGAGGAGGYTGNGGNGGSFQTAGTAGSGGGGGGGGAGPLNYSAPYYTYGGGGGGGVGLLGIGANGAGGTSNAGGGGGGGGGSGGANGGDNSSSTGAGGTGGNYGGAGATGFYNGTGSYGAVRIIWAGGSGALRSYPSNAADVAS
jgi:hypothetical protein